MTSKHFLTKYAYVYLYILCFFLLCAAGFRSIVETMSSTQTLTKSRPIIIDAGHGGIDSGTTSCTGIPEKDINLQIAIRLEKLMLLMGYDTVMTRHTDDSIATEGETIRQQKQSDLRNRTIIANQYADGILISIHQNYYADSRYWGPQIFYNDNTQSKALAHKLQTALNQITENENHRLEKYAEKVYLMKNAACTSVLIECGFLSNPEEESRLKTAEYQKKLCCVISSVIADFITAGAVV